MGYQYLQTDVAARTGLITVDFPPANALAPEVRAELERAVPEMMARDDVWTIVITAAGRKFFMAGANIPSLLDLDRPTGLARVQAARALFDRLESGPKPVIAAINGLCLGAGLELALAGDIRLAAEHVKLGLPEVALGLMPGGGGTQRLPRIVGPGLAAQMIFSAKTLSAAEAREVGLVQEVTPAEELIPAALALAERINHQGPLGVRAAKRALYGAKTLGLAQGLDLENELWADLCDTRDMKEGVAAFLEKRPPVFEAK
jgi:enoyl-CoA hydratase/carnithine racemase